MPACEHCAHFVVCASGSVSQRLQHLLVGIKTLNERNERVGAELSAKPGQHFHELLLRQRAFFHRLGKRGNGFHRIDELAGCLRCLNHVTRVNFQNIAEALDLFFCYGDAFLNFRCGVTHDVEDDGAERARRFAAGHLRFRRDRSECGQKLFLRNVRLRRYRGDDRHAARQFFDACRIVVVDLVRLIYDERQRLHGAAQFVRRVHGDKHFIGRLGIDIADELRFRGYFGKPLRQLAVTGAAELGNALQKLVGRHAVFARSFVSAIVKPGDIAVACPCDLLDRGEFAVHLFHGGNCFSDGTSNKVDCGRYGAGFY